MFFSGQMTANDFTFDVNFGIDYRKFFDEDYNTLYKDEFAKLGIIYATLAYDGTKIKIDKGMSFEGGGEDFFENLNLKDIEVYSLPEHFKDDDVSEMIIGHRVVKYANRTKDIVIVAVRGTNATIEEWSSNFDVGANTDDY